MTDKKEDNKGVKEEDKKKEEAPVRPLKEEVDIFAKEFAPFLEFPELTSKQACPF